MDPGRPKSHTGDYNIKRRFGKGFRNSKKSMTIFSSHKKEETDGDYEESLNGTPHRSCSLNALHTGPVLLQPRMAQLETLEAKMARIENSLSTTPRKKKISSSNNSISSALVASNTNLSVNGISDASHTPLYENKSTNSLKSVSTFLKISPNLNGSANNALIYKTSKDIAREMEALKSALRDKEDVIDNLKGQLNTTINYSRPSTTYLQAKQKNDQICNDKQVAEERLSRLKHEMDNKTTKIKNIKSELERLDITDNIDIRIQQAELEYQLGREELNLLSILEEIQSAKIVLEEQDVTNGHQNEATLFSHIHKKHSIALHSTEIMYDPKSPRFGANVHDNTNSLTVDWATEDSGLMKGDLLLEINGKLTLGLHSRDDMVRLLSVSPKPAQIVVMRYHKTDAAVSSLKEELDTYREKAGEAERIRDSFRSDNVRLTHRISYLEEQVAELLARTPKKDAPSVKTSIENHNNISQQPQIQIFQKGPKVTLINNVPSSTNSLKIRDTLPTVSTRLRSRSTCKSMDGLESSKLSESMASPLSTEKKTEAIVKPELRNRSICYMNYQSPSSTKNKENYCMINERRLRYIKEAQNSLRNSSLERSQRRFKDDRSCKSVDFDSEPNYQSLKQLANGRLTMYDSETSSDYSRTIKYPRPTPPQKPLRLSLHKGCSLQSVKIIDKSNGDIELKKNHQKLDGYGGVEKKMEKWC